MTEVKKTEDMKANNDGDDNGDEMITIKATPREKIKGWSMVVVILTFLAVTAIGFPNLNSNDDCEFILSLYLFSNVGVLSILLLIFFFYIMMIIHKYPHCCFSLETSTKIRDIACLSVVFVWALFGFVLITAFPDERCEDDFPFLINFIRAWVLFQIVMASFFLGFRGKTTSVIVSMDVVKPEEKEEKKDGDEPDESA